MKKSIITFSLQVILLVTLSFSPFLYVTACVHPNWIGTQQRTSFLVTVYHVQFKCRMPSVIIYRCNYENNHIFPSTKQCLSIDCEFHSTWAPPGNAARVLTTCALTGPESGGTSNRRTLKRSYKCNTFKALKHSLNTQILLLKSKYSRFLTLNVLTVSPLLFSSFSWVGQLNIVTMSPVVWLAVRMSCNRLGNYFLRSRFYTRLKKVVVDAHARTPRHNFPPLVWHYTLRAEALQTELFALKSEERNVQSIWPNIDFA